MLLFLEDAERAAMYDAAGPGVIQLRHGVAVAGPDRDRLESAQAEIGVDAVVWRVVAVADDQDAIAHAERILSDGVSRLTSLEMVMARHGARRSL